MNLAGLFEHTHVIRRGMVVILHETDCRCQETAENR